MTRPAGLSDQVWAAYETAIVIDGHNDMPSKLLDDAYDPDVRHPAGVGPDGGHTDLPRLLESGITAQWMVAWVDAAYAHQAPGASHARAVAAIEAIREWVARHPEQLLLATTGADVRRAKREGRVAILIGVEGGHAIEDSLDKLRDLYDRGARYLTLTWNNGNRWAGSSIGTDSTSTGGLTAFGRDVIRAMNRLGMLVDVSHVSSPTLRDVLATTEAPIIASHSNARALADHPRNVTDDEARAIAATGGVIGVNFYPRFLDPAFLAGMVDVDAAVAGTRARLAAEGHADAAHMSTIVAEERRRLVAALPATPLAVLADHIDHLVRVAGPDHVALGSDFDGISALPTGLEDVTALPRLAQVLADRHYDSPAMTAILGGNLLRVMEAVL